MKKFFINVIVIAACLYGSGCRKDSNKRSFTVTSVAPLNAGAGDTITITGTNLTSAGDMRITLNGKSVNIAKASATSLKIVVPKMVGSGKLTLTNSAGTYENSYFYYKYRATVTTLAGASSPGRQNGKGSEAAFYCPWGITVDANGDLYIADTYNRLIRKVVTATGLVSSIDIPTLVQGGNFFSPYNIAINKSTRDVYVTDFNSHMLHIDPSGSMSIIYNAPSVETSTGVAVAADGNVFMSLNTKGKIIKFDAANNYAQSEFTTDLFNPRNIVFDKSNRMFVSAYSLQLGPVIHQIDNSGKATVAANDLSNQGWEIAVDDLGNFYEADHFSNNLKMIEKDGRVNILAGSGASADVDGVGLKASFNGPQGIAINAAGELFITTYNYDTKGGNKVRKVVIE